MFEQDFDEFDSLVSAIWMLKGQAPLTSGAKALFFRALATHPIEEVRAGLDAHLRDPKRGQYLPMPADVIAQIMEIVANDGRPGMEEAWSISFRAKSEAATVVWTSEMCQAFFLCKPLLDAGDDVGGRMAFKEAYTRLVTDARAARTSTQWSATLGYDIEARDAILLPHVECGRIDRSMLAGPAVGLETLLALPAPIDITPASAEVRLAALEKLRSLRTKLVDKSSVQSLDAEHREHTDSLKALTQEKFSAYESARAA